MDDIENGVYKGVKYFDVGTVEAQSYQSVEPPMWPAVKRFQVGLHELVLQFSEDVPEGISKERFMGGLLIAIAAMFAHSFVAAGAVIPDDKHPMQYMKSMALATKLFDETVKVLVASDFKERITGQLSGGNPEVTNFLRNVSQTLGNLNDDDNPKEPSKH